MYEKWVNPIFEVEGKGGDHDPPRLPLNPANVMDPNSVTWTGKLDHDKNFQN